MKSSFFDYKILPERIAQTPLPNRSASRLLSASANGTIDDRHFYDLPVMLNSNDLLILNDTRVLLARFTAYRQGSGGQVEILIERQTGPYTCLAQIRASNKPKEDTSLVTEKGFKLLVTGKVGQFYDLRITSDAKLQDVLDVEGTVPLPPYIQRPTLPEDRNNYQTIYAKSLGAVAAPTAGLHFDEKLFIELERRGVSIRFVTLHVGAATFQPIRTHNIEDHEMHSEWISVCQDTVDSIHSTRKQGGRVVAVGTTVVRALESAVQKGVLTPREGYTDLYITPGFRFQVVDMMLTNFHQPKSSLYVLVSAFFGLCEIRRVYSHGINKGYRFYSYGDAMYLERRIG